MAEKNKEMQKSNARDYLILGIVIVWGLFLVIYTVFFEYRWLNFPNWK